MIWVAPRLQGDIQELKIVSDIFGQKYGKPFADSVRDGNGPIKASEKLQHKLEIHAPPKLLVEKYLIEIAKVFNVEYEPDPQVMSQRDGTLIDLSTNNGPPPQLGFVGYPSFPILPAPPTNTPFNYPPPGGGTSASVNTPTLPSSSHTSKENEAQDTLAKFLDEEKSPPPPSYDSLSASNSYPVSLIIFFSRSNQFIYNCFTLSFSMLQFLRHL